MQILGVESVSNSIAITDIWWGSIFDGRNVGPVIVETKHIFTGFDSSWNEGYVFFGMLKTEWMRGSSDTAAGYSRVNFSSDHWLKSLAFLGKVR